MIREANPLGEMTYRARRYPLAIDITVTDQEVTWVYRWLGNQWTEQLPLTTLVPFPTLSVDRLRSRRTSASALAVAVGGCGMMIACRDLSWLTALGALLAIVGLALAVIAWRRGPLEWADFGSFIPGKSVYFFRGSQRAEFDEFVARLKERIQAARPGCALDPQGNR